MSDPVEWACEFCGSNIADGDGVVFVADQHWHSAHDGCGSAEPREHPIPIAELRTEVEVIHQTAHLLETPWLAGTDWYQLLLNVSDRKGNAASSVR
jgi:hypothetical protein